MPTLDDARRWVVDQFSKDEELIAGSPKKAMRELSKNLAGLTPEERVRNLEHVKAYADLYYQGRHKEPLPPEVKQAFRELDRRTERLNTVDQARLVVQKYGGPPTRETIEDSLERSFKQRSKEFTATQDRSAGSETVRAQTRQKERTREHSAEV